MHVRLRFTLALTLLAVACDRATGPREPGSLVIATTTTGLDIANFAVQVDDKTPRSIDANGALTVDGIVPGAHTVRVLLLAANCTVQGSNPATVTVDEGKATAVPIAVVCTAATGVVEITTTTSGIDAPVAYNVTVDATNGRYIAPAMTIAIAGVSGGAHGVELQGLSSNCAVANGALRNITVGVGGLTRDTVRLAFDVSCGAATGIIEIAFSVATPDFGNTFQVQIGNQSPRALQPNATTRIPLVAGGDYVVALANLPTNCSAVGSPPSVTVKTGGATRDTARTTLQANCIVTDKIAFSRNGSLMVVNADGTNVITLSSGFNPSWSADGTRIVYAKFYCDYYYYYYCSYNGLFVLDRRNGVVPDAQISNGTDDFPAWSPDGNEIAFVRDSRFIHLMKPDGSGITRVQLPNSTYISSRPTWSPDGTRFVFGCGDQSIGYLDVCVMNRNGSGFARLTDSARSNDQPTWSPDGTQIAFVREEFQDQRGSAPQPYIALMKADGTGMAKLTDGSTPAWSKDGSRLVFRSLTQGGLFTIKTDGTALSRLTSDENDQSPSWRP